MQAEKIQRLDFLRKKKRLAELRAKKQSVQGSGISETESALRGGAQALTLGFADEIVGGIEALWEQAKGNPEEFGNLYKQFRDESRANFDKAREANPGSYIGTEIGTGVATAFIPGLNVAKGAKAASVAAKAAGIGATGGAGYSEGETVGEVAEDSLKGAAIGAGTAALAPVLGKGLAKVGRNAKGTAERLAARAVGAERGTIKKIGQANVQKAGRYALDEGIVTPMASADDLVSRNQTAQGRGAKMMDEVYSSIDDVGASTFNPLDVATKVDDELGGFYRSPINRGETKQLENTLESIMMRGDKNIPIKEAQTLKRELGRVANWKNNLNITEKEKMARAAYGMVSDAIDDAVENGAKVIGKSSIDDTLARGKHLYSQSKTVENLLENKVAREQGNKLMGLTDWFLLGAGAPVAAATGGASVPGTVAVLTAKKGLEKFGASTAAVASDKVAKALAKAPEAASKVARSPVAAQSLTARPLRTGAQKALSQVADKKDDKPKRGPEKWASDGFEKILEHSNGNFKGNKGAMLKNPKAKNLLIAASELKPGSKAMANIFRKIKKDYGEVKN